MKVFNFDLLTDKDVIIVNASIEGKHKFRLALDIAATHTTIDSNVLYFSGYELEESRGEGEVETSNGIIVVETYDEAEEFLKHPVLDSRLVRICNRYTIKQLMLPVKHLNSLLCFLHQHRIFLLQHVRQQIFLIMSDC